MLTPPRLDQVAIHLPCRVVNIVLSLSGLHSGYHSRDSRVKRQYNTQKNKYKNNK